MARDPDHLAGSLENENTGGILTGFLAEEDELDRRSLWRLGSWGVASVGAIVIALLANQSSIGSRRDQVAAADLARQSQQIQMVAKESQNETRRLASAIDTLSGDRDRLYSRVTVLEQGLDSVTGAIARQNSAAASPPGVPAASATTEPQPVAQNPPPAPVISPAATTVAATTVAAAIEKPRADAPAPLPAPVTIAAVGQAPSNPQAATPPTSLMASKSLMAPPDSGAAKLIEPDKATKTSPAVPGSDMVAATPAADEPEPDASEATPARMAAVQRTEFGVDLGGANSVGGLRALWRGLLKSRSNAALTTLRPIMVIKEGNNGLGMQLRLVAGPLSDAAAAAKICAGLIENERPCETTVFDGQRLAMKGDEPAAAATRPDTAKPEIAKPDAAKPDTAKPGAGKPANAKPMARRRFAPKRAVSEEPAKKPESTTFSSLFGRR